jgi:putative hydrolase of the HAD superfamily
MTEPLKITTLFLDIGGVLLTDGWSLDSRTLAATTFELDARELEARHHQAFDTYEVGKLTLDEYLDLVVFHQQRAFSPEQFKAFMFARSQPYLPMLDLIRALRARHSLKILVVSNEGRELNAHRIRQFKLDEMVDAFISSCYVHLRKPDLDLYRLALDIAQTPAEQIIYLENTPMFVAIAEGLGIRGILHTGYPATRAALASCGLSMD